MGPGFEVVIGEGVFGSIVVGKVEAVQGRDYGTVFKDEVLVVEGVENPITISADLVEQGNGQELARVGTKF